MGYPGIVRLSAVSALSALVLAAPAQADGDDLRRELFFDTALAQPVSEGSDPLINESWGDDDGPSGVGDTFSMRWTGQIEPRFTEAYEFPVERDDNVRLWVGGQLLHEDDWSSGNQGEVVSDPISLQAGRRYDLKLEFADRYGEAYVRLNWRSASQAQQIVPASGQGARGVSAPAAATAPRPSAEPRGTWRTAAGPRSPAFAGAWWM